MVFQHDKLIAIWGWAEQSDKVTFRFGEEKADTT
jgi:hypothetical protein